MKIKVSNYKHDEYCAKKEKRGVSMNNTNSEMKLDETKSNVAQSENIIELKNITKQYDDLLVLDNLNLDIKKNEFLTLLGPSGCGKTTTLKIIAGFEHADEGAVMFEGVNVNDTPPYERQVNTVFQKYALFPHMNVYENIACGLKIKKNKLYSQIKTTNQTKFSEIVEACGESQRYGIYPEKIYVKDQQIYMDFGNVRACLGNQVSAEQIAQIRPILKKLGDKTGILHLESYSENNTTITFEMEDISQEN